MKIIITSDFHLDKNNRLDDFDKAINQIADFAVEKKVNWVLFLGDAFQRRRPSPIEMRRFEKWIKRLTKAEIKVLLLVGNHDENLMTSTIDYFRILEVPNVYVKKSPYIFKNCIYLGHHVIRESVMGPLNYKLPDSNTLTVDNLVNKYPNIKIFALGHIHKPQVIKKQPYIFHVGSVERIDFGERNEEKRFIYINGNKLKSIPIKTRQMFQVEIDLDRGIKIARKPDEAIIKVIIRGKKEKLKALDEQEIRKELEGAYQIKLRYEPKRETNLRYKAINEKVSPESCFLKYAEAHNFDEKTIEIGKKIMGGIKL